jgi:DNA-binding NarL/FixJ family response regulator
MKILIADDFQPVRNSLRKLLQTIRGIAILPEATNGDEAVEMMKKYGPDIIILDLQMPGRTGLEILREFKPRLMEAVVIILTNHATTEIRKECKTWGADYVLDKTMEFSRVLEIVQRLTQGQETH